MKILVATQELSGRTLGKIPPRLVRGSLATFSYVPEGEILMPLVCWEVIGCSHNNDGCHMALGGTATPKATTNFKVTEQPITLEELEKRFFKTLKAQGWADSQVWHLPEETLRWIAGSFARAISRAAAKFPTGDVLSKRGCTFWSRKKPQCTAKIVVTLPRNA